MGASTIDAKKCPAYWFLLLEDARQRGDLPEANLAKARLERLGVVVTYLPPHLGRAGDAGQVLTGDRTRTEGLIRISEIIDQVVEQILARSDSPNVQLSCERRV